MGDSKKSKKVAELLQGPLELDPKSASDIIRIVTWAEMTGMRISCAAFLKMYNKGSVPTNDKTKEALEELEGFIQEHTYFGRLLQPIYDVIYHHRNATKIAAVQTEQQIGDLLASLGIEM